MIRVQQIATPGTPKQAWSDPSLLTELHQQQAVLAKQFSELHASFTALVDKTSGELGRLSEHLSANDSLCKELSLSVDEVRANMLETTQRIAVITDMVTPSPMALDEGVPSSSSFSRRRQLPRVKGVTTIPEGERHYHSQTQASESKGRLYLSAGGGIASASQLGNQKDEDP